MSESAKITIDLPAADSGFSASFATVISLAVPAVVCGVMAIVMVLVLRRNVKKLSRGTCVVVASAFSVLPVLALVLLAGVSYEGADNPIYTFATFLPVLGLCLIIVLFISAPLAWLVTRTGKGTSGADVFE